MPETQTGWQPHLISLVGTVKNYVKELNRGMKSFSLDNPFVQLDEVRGKTN